MTRTPPPTGDRSPPDAIVPTTLDLHVLEALVGQTATRPRIRQCVDHAERLALSDDEISGALDRLSRAGWIAGDDEAGWTLRPDRLDAMPKTVRTRRNARRTWFRRQFGMPKET